MPLERRARVCFKPVPLRQALSGSQGQGSGQDSKGPVLRGLSVARGTLGPSMQSNPFQRDARGEEDGTGWCACGEGATSDGVAREGQEGPAMGGRGPQQGNLQGSSLLGRNAQYSRVRRRPEVLDLRVQERAWEANPRRRAGAAVWGPEEGSQRCVLNRVAWSYLHSQSPSRVRG